jgi:hypothetical protein
MSDGRSRSTKGRLLVATPPLGDPNFDRSVVLTVDDDGAWQRCKPNVQRKTSRSAFAALSYAERIAECERPEPGLQYLRDTFG